MDAADRRMTDAAAAATPSVCGLSADALPADDLSADVLAWRAFCYLHGELTADEAEVFEEDLAARQAAREALAQAVKLSAALEMAGPAVPDKSGYGTRGVPATLRGRAAWWRRVSRAQWAIGAGVAACLALAITLGLSPYFSRDGRVGPGPESDPQAIAQAAVAEAWAAIASHDPENSGPESNFEEDHEHDESLHDEGARLPSVPSWLLAAVEPQGDSGGMKQ